MPKKKVTDLSTLYPVSDGRDWIDCELCGGLAAVSTKSGVFVDGAPYMCGCPAHLEFYSDEG